MTSAKKLNHVHVVGSVGYGENSAAGYVVVRACCNQKLGTSNSIRSMQHVDLTERLRMKDSMLVHVLKRALLLC